jgi:hypothetical protein
MSVRKLSESRRMRSEDHILNNRHKTHHVAEDVALRGHWAISKRQHSDWTWSHSGHPFPSASKISLHAYPQSSRPSRVSETRHRCSLIHRWALRKRRSIGADAHARWCRRNHLKTRQELGWRFERCRKWAQWASTQPGERRMATFAQLSNPASGRGSLLEAGERC